MAKKMPIKVLGCLVVILILMSTMPVSVFAVQESSSSETVSAQGDQGDCSPVVKFKGTATTNEKRDGSFYDNYYCKVKVEELLSNPGNKLKSGNVYTVFYGDSPKSIKTGDKLEVYGIYYHTCGPLQGIGNIRAYNDGYYIKKIEKKKPDLIIKDISWSPSSLDKGDTIKFTVKIKNQGSGSAGSSTVKYYIDGSYVGSDSVSKLSAGSTSTETFTWTASKCGDVKVKAVADANNDVYECGGKNNDRTETVSIKCPTLKPDLIIKDISWSPSSPKQGDTITFTVKIKNQGTGSAGSSRVNYYIDGSYVDYDSVPTLSASSTSTQKFTWTANKCGTVQVKAVADANNAVSESNEGNNARTETMSVTCPTLKPDLIIQDIYWSPSSPKQGGTITFTVKIKNQDTGSAGSSRVNYYIDGSYVGYDSVPALSAGSTSTQTFTWTANKCGNVQVKAVADANNAVDEGGNDGNNDRTETINVICGEKPAPEIIKVIYPTACVKEGEDATISVTVKNNGGASSEGYISVSFPNDEQISDVSGTGSTYNKLYPKGSWIWNNKDQQMESVDPLVELLDTSWEKGQQETITMNVKPNSGSDEIVFYVRAALKNDADGTYERDPTYSGYTDQQGWYVERHVINVCPKEACVIIDDDTCVGYKVYVDDVYQHTEGVGETLDGSCTFYVAGGIHTIEICDNGRHAAITRNFEGTYTWNSMPDNWCKCNAAVKFRGVIVKETYPISFYNYKVKIDEILEDPSGVLSPGDEVWVWAHADGPALVDSVGIDDQVEVYGTYDGEPHREVKLETVEHYLRALKVSVIIDDDTCVGYEVWVDGTYKLTDSGGDGYCSFSVAEGTHTIEIRDNDRHTSITRSFDGSYTWNTMPDSWCKGNVAVKFNGVIVKDSSTSSFYNYKVKIDDVLTDPSDVLSPGDEVWVWAPTYANVDAVSIDDQVEVYGTYDGEPRREVKLETAGHSLMISTKAIGDAIRLFQAPGSDSVGLAWDGKYLWYADGNFGTSKIYKLDPSDCSVISSFPAPDEHPVDLAWDGEYLWNVDYIKELIYKIDSSDGRVVKSIPAPTGIPWGLTWDGAFLWVSEWWRSDRIYKVDPSDGSVITSFSGPAGGLTWDGNFLWSCKGGTIYKIDPSTGTIITSFSAPPDIYHGGLAWNGEYLWSTEDDIIWQIDVDDRIPVAPKTIYVDDNYVVDDASGHKWNTIQEGINDAGEGDTVFVYSGTYYENVIITKNGLKLIGEDQDTTIIDGNGEGDVITLTSSNCLITNFTIRNSGDLYTGISLDHSSYSEISSNIISFNGYGISTSCSDNNTIRNNLVSNNDYYGMLIWLSTNNTIIENTILENYIGIYTHSMFCYHSFYHNNFINNGIQASDSDFEENYWCNKELREGNYWSDYKEKYPNAKDKDGNGIWDTPYEIPGEAGAKDNYPLVESRGEVERPKEDTLTVIVKYPDDRGIIPDAAILYDDDWNIIKRLYPTSNKYTFTGMNAGTYHAEAYRDNMFIGRVENIEVSAGKPRSVTLTTHYKRNLDITVYYKDTSTPVGGVTFKVYSWDGYKEEWDYEYKGTTSSQGEVTFSSWPTSLVGEKYKLNVELRDYSDTKEPIYVDKYSGSSYTLRIDKQGLDCAGIAEYMSNAITFYGGYIEYWFNSSYWRSLSDETVLGDVSENADKAFKYPVESMAELILVPEYLQSSLGVASLAHSLIEIGADVMDLVYAMAYDITGTYISGSETRSVLDDLKNLKKNSENLRSAALHCNEDTIKELLMKRKGILKDLYTQLDDYDLDMYLSARRGAIYFNLMLPTRFANHWAYCTIKSLIVSLHLQLQEDYIFTTYHLNRIDGRDDFEKLNSVVKDNDGRIGSTRIDSSGLCSVILGCIDEIDESNEFKIELDADDVGSNKKLYINLAYCLKTKEGVDGLTMYVKYGEKPTTSYFDKKGSYITIEDPQKGSYYVLLKAENALGPYRLEAQICAKKFLSACCKSIDIYPSGAVTKQYPHPKIVDIHVDKNELLYEESVTLTVTVTNNGGTSNWQSIVISSPDITNSDSYEILSYNMDYFEKYDIGFEAGASYGTETKKLEYPLIEGAKKDWAKGISREVKLTIKPEQAGDLRIYVKSVAFGEGVWVSDPGIFGTSIKDQQDEYVKDIIVKVIGNRAPNKPTKPDGLSSGNVGALLCFSTSATDPDGDPIKYTFDWNDGDTTETELVASGTQKAKCHRWSNEGTYDVRVKATDEEGKSSELSDPLTVKIEKFP